MRSEGFATATATTKDKQRLNNYSKQEQNKITSHLVSILKEPMEYLEEYITRLAKLSPTKIHLDFKCLPCSVGTCMSSLS